jgi:hypothetical protein
MGVVNLYWTLMKLGQVFTKWACGKKLGKMMTAPLGTWFYSGAKMLLPNVPLSEQPQSSFHTVFSYK